MERFNLANADARALDIVDGRTDFTDLLQKDIKRVAMAAHFHLGARNIQLHASDVGLDPAISAFRKCRASALARQASAGPARKPLTRLAT
jgi:hypothetical protein